MDSVLRAVIGLIAVPVPLGDVLFYTLFPAGAVILGGTIAIFRVPSLNIQSMIQHFAGGVVFAAVAVELLPDVMRMHEPGELILGFALGVAVMLGVRALGRKLEPAEEAVTPLASPPLIVRKAPAALPVGLLVAVAVDITLDGLLVGIAFAAGSHAGLLITLALTLEVLFLSLSTVAAVQKAGVRRLRLLGLPIGLALLLAGGAVGGSVILSGMGEAVLAVVLAFGLAALLYLVTEELLVEAHEVPETMFATATFFAGFLVLLLITLYMGA